MLPAQALNNLAPTQMDGLSLYYNHPWFLMLKRALSFVIESNLKVRSSLLKYPEQHQQACENLLSADKLIHDFSPLR